MPAFRKRPVEIEAMLYDSADAVDGILAWMDKPDTSAVYAEGELFIHTLEGKMHASLGDWIICGTEGEFYPCKPAAFEATFEPVE